MKIDYIPLANVPTVESLTDSAKVLVVDNGEVKKTAVANVGGDGGEDFSALTKLSYTVEGNILTFPYTWEELYALWSDDVFRPYFVYDGQTYIFLTVTDGSFEGTELYSAVYRDIVIGTESNIGGVANDPVAVEMGDSPK